MLPTIRVFPPGRWRNYALDLQRVDYLSPTTEGRLGSVTAGAPLFTLAAAPSLNTEAQSDAWVAWVDSLRGAQRTFYAGPLRSLPAEYVKGLPSGFSGDATSWALNVDRDALTLSGLPAGFTLRPGDMVGFRWGERRTMVKVLETVSGAIVTTAIEPPLPLVVSGAAVAHVLNPVAEFRLTPDTKVGPAQGSRTRTVELSAVQHLRQ